MAVPPVHAQRSRRDEHVTAHKSAASFGPPIFTQIFATFAIFCSKFSSLLRFATVRAKSEGQLKYCCRTLFGRATPDHAGACPYRVECRVARCDMASQLMALFPFASFRVFRGPHSSFCSKFSSLPSVRASVTPMSRGVSRARAGSLSCAPAQKHQCKVAPRSSRESPVRNPQVPEAGSAK